MNERAPLSPYRWMIELLLLLLLTVQSLTWLAPAPILQEIQKGLHIDLGSAGLILSIIALCIGIFSILGAIVLEKLGALRCLQLGLGLMALAEIASGYTDTFGTLFLCRVVEGIGFGMVIAPPGALTMQWFGEHEWAYINMVNFAFGYVGLTAVFRITPGLFAAVHQSWQSVLLDYGLLTAAVALLWIILGRQPRTPSIETPDVAASADDAPGGSAIVEVMKMRNILLIAAGLFGGMWVFQIYTAFLPEYFRAFRGMSLEQASLMTQVLPFTGFFAAVLGGLGTGWTGLRKPFTWPVAIFTLVGCVGAITLSDPLMIRLSLVLVGIGAAGSLAAITTLMMELPGMNPTRVGAAQGFVWAVGYFGAFVSPVLGGKLAASMGLKTVMLGFLVFQFLPIVAMYFLPETGPGKTRYEIEEAERAAAVGSIGTQPNP
ncbi:MAG TPA: MFS transporter [Candidatus Binataceae bacterium]|nr:MFS transporter [Candidatus Binataceae bacterium]